MRMRVSILNMGPPGSGFKGLWAATASILSAVALVSARPVTPVMDSNDICRAEFIPPNQYDSRAHRRNIPKAFPAVMGQAQFGPTQNIAVSGYALVRIEIRI